MSKCQVSVIGLLMLCSAAAAQVPSPDNMELLVPGSEATGNLTLGCCTWDPVNQVFLTGTFGSSREFRRIDMKTNPPTVTVLAYTSDGTSFALASNIPGGVTRWSSTGNLNPSGVILNTAPLTVGGIAYPPYTLAFLADNGQTVYEGGSVIHRDWSKRFYRWDMREVAAPTSRQPDYNTAQDGGPYGNVIGAYGIADWNDVFTVLATEQNILDAFLPLLPIGTPTFNIGRQPVLSTDSKYLYFNDSASDFGGIWRIHTETGAVSIIYNDRDQSDRINTEPTLLHTSLRDLDPANPAVGDQVLFEGDGSLNEGGINYLIDTGAAILGPYVLLTESQLQRWIEWNGQSWTRSYPYLNADPIPSDTALSAFHAMGIRSMWSDESGNIYFNDGANLNGVWRYDTQGRLGLLRSKQQHVLWNAATVGSGTNATTYRMQTRGVQYSGPAGSFPLQQIMFQAVGQRGIGGINAFKTGDFNRDNVVNQADVDLMMAAMQTPIETVQTFTLGSSSWSLPVTLAAGGNTIEARSIDRAGNPSNTLAYTVTCTVDTTPPTVTVNSPTPGQTIGTRSVAVNGNAADTAGLGTGVIAVEVRVNSGAWQKASGTTSWNTQIGLSVGANAIQVRSLDLAGNYSTLATVNVNCNAPADNTPPTVTIGSPYAGQLLETWSTVVSGSSSDSGSAGGVNLVEVRLNGGAWQATNTTSGYAAWNLPMSFVAGSNTVEARSRDYVGNYSAIASVTFTSQGPADTTIPRVAISTPIDAEGFVAGIVAVTGTASETGSNPSGVGVVEVRLNGGAWQPAVGTATWTANVSLPVGTNTIEARSRDNAGNYSEIAMISLFGYSTDNTPPTVTIASPANGQTIGYWSYTVAGTAADPGAGPSGVGLVEARVNGGAWKAATGRAAWTCPVTLAAGANTIEVRSRDYAGNVSSIQVVTLNSENPAADATLPTVTISSPTNGSTVQTFTPTLSGSANDADPTRSGVAAVEVRINGGDWMPASVTTASNTVRYGDMATDGAGNPLETATDRNPWANYLKYDLNGNGLVTAKDKLLMWRHLGYAPVDYDRDGDVDMVDFGHFQACWTGTDIPQRNWMCGDAKLDWDDDVDPADLAMFIECASGPALPADPACMD